jgi:EAL domain-containing protein (putative c-di-GMP-specific phosphodiesterase class I)
MTRRFEIEGKMHEQLTLLEELKCDYAQGYYLSKPITAKQLLELKYIRKS